MIVRKVEINAIYEKPEMQVVELFVSDVIRTSGDKPFPGEDDVFN